MGHEAAEDFVFQPTHVVPPGGLPSWAGPDPSRPTARLDPLLPVQLTEVRGDWGRVVCSNGWSAWVNGRLLVALPHGPAGAARPLGTTEDPRPLLARLEQALAGYRQLVDDLAGGRIDLETFRDRAAGLRIGAVVDGGACWLFEPERNTWSYCDGARLRTFAVVDTPPAGRPVVFRDDG